MGLRIHHLNCGTDCPFGGGLMDGRSRGPLAHLVCHCLLVETNDGLVLVDTGYGLKDVRRPFPRLSRPFAALLNIRLREQETAVRQVEALGFSPSDVRHIVLTHLDFDHAGGLEDFPAAKVHVMAAELDAVANRRGFVARNRYRPMQFDAVAGWRRYTAQGEPWQGFEAVRDLDGLPPEILLVPLKGHTWGHAGVAVATEAGWLLHAGDAYFHADEIAGVERRCPPGLRLYQNMMEVDRASRLSNQRRLRDLARNAAAGVEIICAHDASEFARHRAAKTPPSGAGRKADFPKI
jgi:glyoxylase-like metal-dependent hydrolase (beta-lactamase superfamily II)